MASSAYCQYAAGRAVDVIVYKSLLAALRPSAITVGIKIDRAQRRRHRTLKLEQGA